MSTPQNVEVRPVGRYEWEQIIRRARLTGLISGTGRQGKDGRATRGGLTAITVKAVALAFATYASDKGTEIWPGDATVATDLECSLKTVKAVKAKLLAVGLMQRVRAANRYRGEEYRLTLPVDLLELLEVLTPAQHQLAARALREAARGKRGTTPTDPDHEGWGGPPVTPKEEMGGSAGHPQGGGWGGPPVTPKESVGGSAGPAHDAMGGSAGPTWGGPADPRTDHDRTSTTTDHSEIAVRTAVTVPRVSRAEQDQISSDVGGDSASARRSTSTRPADTRPPDSRPPDSRPRSRPARVEGVEAAEPAPDNARHPAVAAFRATLDAQRATARQETRTRPPGAAWEELRALTDNVSTAA